MKAIAVIKPEHVDLVEVAKPAVGKYQALVRTEIAALCNATDGKLISGHFPGIEDYPLMLGHESCGIVEMVGEKVRNFKVGDRAIGGLVFDFPGTNYISGWGGFCEYTLVNDHDAMVADGVADEEHGWFECYEIQRKTDHDIPPEEATLLCTWREVYAAFGDFNLQPGNNILVFGAGPVGLSFVKFGKLLELDWIGVVDPLEHKRNKALSMGADAVFAPESPEFEKLYTEKAGKFDAVIDAVGKPAIINKALPLIKLGGSVCVYGVIAESRLPVEKSSGPLNFNLFVHQWPTRWREREAQKPLSDWIRQGKLKASEFVTHEFKVERINDALVAVKNGSVIKCLLKYT
ncbi:MAG: zinc-binding dehydrogenase [Bacteroidales bacterium]|nr:zinc-binding dehydrogenase [Bacteroidales bacterium]